MNERKATDLKPKVSRQDWCTHNRRRIYMEPNEVGKRDEGSPCSIRETFTAVKFEDEIDFVVLRIPLAPRVGKVELLELDAVERGQERSVRCATSALGMRESVGPDDGIPVEVVDSEGLEWRQWRWGIHPNLKSDRHEARRDAEGVDQVLSEMTLVWMCNDSEVPQGEERRASDTA